MPFEDAGAIAPWIAQRGHAFGRVALWDGQALPQAEAFDWLIVMGGPMNVDEHAAYPWLAAEQALIRAAMAAGKPVLGICLGAQLIARALGAPVTRGPEEIGWFDVRSTAAGRDWFGGRDTFTAFHWHGDTFALPDGAEHLASSAACANQAFAVGSAVGLQFHLETTAQSADALMANSDWAVSQTAQSALAMRARRGAFDALQPVLDAVLRRQERAALAAVGTSAPSAGRAG